VLVVEGIRCCRRTATFAPRSKDWPATAKVGVQVSHESPLLPDFVESSRLIYAQAAVLPRTFMLPEVIAGAKIAAAQLSPTTRALPAERYAH